MDGDIDDFECEICFIKYDKDMRIPKITECCKHTYCLKCLTDFYTKNNNKYSCMNCRIVTDKNPKLLITNNSKLEPKKPKCPNCKRECEVKSLFVKMDENQNKNVFIFCKFCLVSNQNYQKIRENSTLTDSVFQNLYSEKISLMDFLETLKYELNYLQENINKFDIIENKNKKSEEALDSKIMKFVDSFFDKFKRNVKTRIKQFMIDYLRENYNYSFEFENELNFINNEFAKNFKSNNQKINSITSINADNVDDLNRAISQYVSLNKAEQKIHYINTAKNFLKNLTLSFAINNNDSFENLIINNLQLKYNNTMIYSNVESYSINNSDKDFTCGIELIDNEFQKLKSNFETCFDDISSFSSKNHELEKQLALKETFIKDLERDLKIYKSKNIELTDANSKLEQHLANINIKFQSHENQRLLELQKNVMLKDNLLNNQNNKINEMNAQIEELLKKLKIVHSRNIELEHQISNAQQFHKGNNNSNDLFNSFHPKFNEIFNSTNISENNNSNIEKNQIISDVDHKQNINEINNKINMQQMSKNNNLSEFVVKDELPRNSCILKSNYDQFNSIQFPQKQEEKNQEDNENDSFSLLNSQKGYNFNQNYQNAFKININNQFQNNFYGEKMSNPNQQYSYSQPIVDINQLQNINLNNNQISYPDFFS